MSIVAAFRWDSSAKAISFMIINEEGFSVLNGPELITLPPTLEDFKREATSSIKRFFFYYYKIE